MKSSPRSWRCFPLKANKHHGIVVFSTLVEVFPVPTTVGCSHVSLLHARGGVSQTDDQLEITIESSPRSWRCFPNLTTEQEAEVVFSTLVEVFLNIKSLRQLGCSLLHARGGVSGVALLLFAPVVSSPRSWRCFSTDGDKCGFVSVFSTLVEVFPIFSLSLLTPIVFSTLVEVFLSKGSPADTPVSLLHARGGVSTIKWTSCRELKSSPRSWRCFLSKHKA